MATESPLCKYCNEPCVFRRATGSSGTRITAWCMPCSRPGRPERIWWPKAGFSQAEIDAMDLVDKRDDQRCHVCTGFFPELEVHHLAPRAQFGDECELWPTVEVCRGCHERWHAKMGQPIGRPQ